MVGGPRDLEVDIFGRHVEFEHQKKSQRGQELRDQEIEEKKFIPHPQGICQLVVRGREARRKTGLCSARCQTGLGQWRLELGAPWAAEGPALRAECTAGQRACNSACSLIPPRVYVSSNAAHVWGESSTREVKEGEEISSISSG